MEDNEYLNLIESCIRTIADQFLLRPHMFFNEAGFHGYCFSVFYRKKQFTEVFPTQDKKLTNILHPEYPSTRRFDKKNCKVVNEKGFSRGCYDLVLLRPQFIQNNDYTTITNKDIGTSKQNKNLLAVLEFKFITEKHRNEKKCMAELNWDYCKLENANEAMKKYMIVFSNTKENEKKWFNKFNFNEDLKLLYLNINFDKNNKKIKNPLILPEGWVKI